MIVILTMVSVAISATAAASAAAYDGFSCSGSCQRAVDMSTIMASMTKIFNHYLPSISYQSYCLIQSDSMTLRF